MAKKKKAVAGRGRKQCPKCSKYVGVRTSLCGCGHEFSVKTPKTKPTKTKGADSLEERRATLLEQKERVDTLLSPKGQKALKALQGKIDKQLSAIDLLESQEEEDTILPF